jgi:hypothetical protein
MSKLRVLFVAAAVLTAACGGAATHSSSNAQPASFTLNAGSNAGANADSNMSDVPSRVNPPVHKGGSTPVMPPSTVTKAAAPPVGQPAGGSAFDRCGGGIGTELQGTRAGVPGGPKRPLPACAVQ